MPKCLIPACTEQGEHTLKLEMRQADNPVVCPVMVRLPVCTAHKMSDEEVGQFIDANWEHICMGFESQKAARPVRDQTTFKWVPWIDAEIFWSENAGDRLTKVRKQ